MVQADIQYPDIKLTKIAFGSCHKNKIKKDVTPIWQAISSIQPQSFIWLGDTIYAPKQNKKQESIASIETLKNEYDNLISNSTIGYIDFLLNASSSSPSLISIHGVHDDHDYGANDYGKQMPDKDERKHLFLNFLRFSNEQLILNTRIDKHDDIDSSTNNDIEKYEKLYQKIKQRNGLYSSIEYGSLSSLPSSQQAKVKLILLDTRSSRDYHCPIPSIGAIKLPFNLGSPLACLTRWFTAGLDLQNKMESCRNAKMLSEEQWTWLEQQLLGHDDDDENDVALYVIGSSVQVLTTNPAIESWGHFPEERIRLLKLLNNIKDGAGVIILSGDVHHGEILDSSAGLKLNGDWNEDDGRIIEVTSSGMTHS
jgi:alkaline phosphatase D